MHDLSPHQNRRHPGPGQQLAGSAGATDQEDTGIAASYTMGNMTISAFNNKTDNAGGTVGKNDEVTQVTMSFAF